MSSTDVGICNRALFRVRADEIGSLDEESASAEKCRVFYPEALNTVLAELKPGWAKQTITLGLKAETPAEWLYAYGYPSDCIEINYILTGANAISAADYPPVEYEILTGDNGSPVIATNCIDAKLSYTKLVTDIRLFDPLSEECFVWLLAQDLAIPLGGDSGKKYRDDAIKGYGIAQGRALANIKNQSYKRIRPPLPNSVQARTFRTNRTRLVE